MNHCTSLHGAVGQGAAMLRFAKRVKVGGSVRVTDPLRDSATSRDTCGLDSDKQSSLELHMLSVGLSEHNSVLSATIYLFANPNHCRTYS